MKKGAIIKKEWLAAAMSMRWMEGLSLIEALCRIQWGEDPGDLSPRAAAALALIRKDLDRSAEMRRRANRRWENPSADGAVHDAVHDAMHDAMHNAMHDAMHDAVHDAVHDAMHDAMHNAVHDAAEGARVCAPAPVRAPYKDAPAKRGIITERDRDFKKEKNIQKKESPASPPESPPGLPFERFWDIYGLKIDKKKCREVYDRLTAADKAAIGAVLIDYVGSTNINGRYPCRKHPLTWLRGRCWEDEGICQKKQVLIPGI